MSYQTEARVQLSDTQFLETIFENHARRAVVQFPERRGFVGMGAGEHWARLDEDHEETRYFCVSLFNADPGVRRIEAFERQCVLVVDDIGEKAPVSNFAGFPAPTYKMYTSAESQQWGWVLTDTPAGRDRGKLDHLVHHIVERCFGGKDPGMLGVTRVVRTPGSYNMKESRRLPDGSAPRAKLYQFNPFVRYSLELLATAIGCNLDEAPDISTAHGAPADWPKDAPMIRAIERGDINVFREGREAGELIVECPNRDQHTLDDDGHRSGKLYMKADGSGGYKCHHGSCEGFKFPQYLAAVGIKDEHDAWVNSMKFKDLIAQIPATPAPVAGVVAESATAAAATPAPTQPAENSNERPDWRLALDTLHSIPDPTANPAALDGLLDAILDLPTMEQGVALGEMKASLKGRISANEFDKIVKRKRFERAREGRIRAHAMAVAGTPLSRFITLPGEINWPVTNHFNGEPVLHVDNVLALVRHWDITVRRNRMSHTLQVNIPGMSMGGDDVDSDQVVAMSSIAKGAGLPFDGIQKQLEYLGNQNPYHPVVDHILSFGDWDGVDRFPRLLGVLKSPHPEVLALVLRRWMRQAIVAAFELHQTTPRRDVLTFLGAQNVGKTTFLQLLTMGIQGAFRGGMHLDVSNKDSVSNATSTWVTELGEVDSTFKKDIAALKAFISNTEDTIREPYAPKASTHLRRTVFVASVNEREFLVDNTGNSRFRVVEVDSIDLDRMRKLGNDGVIGMLWRQILQEVQAGEPWYFNQGENATLEVHGDQYRRRLPIEEAILAVFDMDVAVEHWVDWKASDIHTRLEAAGHRCALNQMAPGIRAAVKQFTGQQKGHRTTAGMTWKLPPIVGRAAPPGVVA